eukprot:gene1343-20835_t
MPRRRRAAPVPAFVATAQLLPAPHAAHAARSFDRCADAPAAATGFGWRLVWEGEGALPAPSRPASCAELSGYCGEAGWGTRVADACPATCGACPPA